MPYYKQYLPKFIKPLFTLSFIICFSACTSNKSNTCLVDNDLVGTWKTQRFIKNNKDLSQIQQWRYIDLLDNGQFIIEIRQPTNMTATSGMEENKRVFYDWNTEYRTKNTFTGNWLFCNQDNTLKLEADKFRKSKNSATVDSLRSFSIQVQNQTPDSLNVAFNKAQVLLVKSKK